MTNIIEFKPSSNTIPIPDTNNVAIDWIWFNSITQVGIVLCEDKVTKQIKGYISSVPIKHEITGEHNDVIYIAQWGAKIPKAIAEAAFGYPLPDYAW